MGEGYAFNKQDSVEAQKQAFVDYSYKTHCICEDSCVVYNAAATLSTIKSSTKTCNMIFLPLNPENYSRSIKNILDLFVSIGLVNIDNARYHLFNGNLLTWTNIKKISDKDTRALFWLFRKCVVDCIIKNILAHGYESLTVYSVGSIKLTSDYDITVYGSLVSVHMLVSQFNDVFRRIFHDSSDSVFDTNVYGTSFMNFDFEDTRFTRLDCNGASLTYLKRDPVYIESQFVWALTGYYNTLILTVGKGIAEQVFEGINSEYTRMAITLHSYLMNQSMSYTAILKRGQLSNNPGVQQEYKTSPLLMYTDYISLANFHASEAYLTRGAFMDVVVNAQVCKGKGVELDVHECVQSAIENLYFFISHPSSTKYLHRTESALERFSDLTGHNCKAHLERLEELSKTEWSTEIAQQLADCSVGRVNAIVILEDVIKTYTEKYTESTSIVPIYTVAYSGVPLDDNSVVKMEKAFNETFSYVTDFLQGRGVESSPTPSTLANSPSTPNTLTSSPITSPSSQDFRRGSMANF